MSSAAKRIQKELAEISLEPPTNCSAGPKGDNLYEWVSSIMGPAGKSSVCNPSSSSSSDRHLCLIYMHITDLTPRPQALPTPAVFSSSTFTFLRTTPSSPQRCAPNRSSIVFRGLPNLICSLFRFFPAHLSVYRPCRDTAGYVSHSDLPLQREQQRPDLPGHPQGPVEPRADHLQGSALHLLTPD